MALRQFQTLLNEQKANVAQSYGLDGGAGLGSTQSYRKFQGRDRRLYFNKALCELQIGLFDKAIATCKAYLKPVKIANRKL